MHALLNCTAHIYIQHVSLSAPLQQGRSACGSSGPTERTPTLEEESLNRIVHEDADEVSTAPLCSKVALVDSVEGPLEASPLCTKVALADSVEDPLEASPLCSPDSSGVPRAPSPLPPSGLRAKEEEAVMRGAPAPSRDYTESAFLEAVVLAPWGCLVAN